MKNKKTLEENRNEIRIGEMTVELIYPKNGKTITECVLSILKQKIK